jgi:hypothetical protein
VKRFTDEMQNMKAEAQTTKIKLAELYQVLEEQF